MNGAALAPAAPGDELYQAVDMVVVTAVGKSKRSRMRSSYGLDEVMSAHLKEAAVVLPVFADEDRLHRRLHVAVNAALTGSLEKGEGAIVRVEDHLLRLALVFTPDHVATARWRTQSVIVNNARKR